MVKILLITLLSMPAIHATADWIEECADLVGPGKSFDLKQASAIIDKHIKEDKDEIAKLEEKSLADKSDKTIWGSIRGSSYRGELSSARARLVDHKKIAHFMAELPQHKKERADLINHLYIVHKHEQELDELMKSYNKSYHKAERFKINALIAAKKVQIKSRMAFIAHSLTNSVY